MKRSVACSDCKGFSQLEPKFIEPFGRKYDVVLREN
jgi:hypothetical protein